jgi:hypothetical protein
MNRRSQFVFVLGPHRSGSSLVAAALHSMGVSLGCGYIEPNEDNPKGFFEDEHIVRLNDRILRSLNLSWDSFGFLWEEDFSSARLKPYRDAAVSMVAQRFAGRGLAGLKDPRFCMLLPFWKSVITEALNVDVKYVVSIREPQQCVRSQRTRHLRDSDFHLLGKRSIQTLLLWWTYLTKALRNIDPANTVFVDYDAMVSAPDLQLKRLCVLLNVELPQAEIDHFCRYHVEPLLNRSSDTSGVTRKQSPEQWGFCDTLYERLRSLSINTNISSADVANVVQELDTASLLPLYQQELQFQNGYSYKKIMSLRHRLIKTIQELGEQQEKVAQLVQEYEALSQHHQMLLSSRGWRILTIIRRYLIRPFQ